MARLPGKRDARQARSRYRSVVYGLEASLELARAVARSGGRTDAETLASTLSYSGVRNGAFLSRLANARLFGLVTGRSGEVVLTDRGHRSLSAQVQESSRACAEACMAVPLFYRVLETYSGESLGDVTHLAEVLESSFGETRAKATPTARVLLESAGQAGLVRDGAVDLSQVRDLVTGFTDPSSDPGPLFVPPVRLADNPRLTRVGRHRPLIAGKGGRAMTDEGTSARGATHPQDDSDLWIDEGTRSSGSHVRRRRMGIVIGAVACFVLIGLPVGLLVEFRTCSGVCVRANLPSHHSGRRPGQSARSSLP